MPTALAAVVGPADGIAALGVIVAFGATAAFDVIPTAEVVALCAMRATGRIMRKNAATRERIFRFTLELRASMECCEYNLRSNGTIT